MQRMPPPDGHHVPPGPHGVYEHAWRPPYHPAPYDGHAPDSRRTSTASAPLPPQYPVNPNPSPSGPEGPYGRPSSLSGPPPHPAQDLSPVHASYRPINGTPHESSPHSAPPDYRARMGFQPPEQLTPTESTPTSASLPPSSQFMTPAPPVPPGTPGPYDPGYYQNPAYGARQRKAARATQACDQCRARKAKCDEGRPACKNNLICVYKEVPPHKQEKTAQLLLDRLMEMEDKFIDRIGRVEKYQADQGQILEQLLGQGPSETTRALKYRANAPIPPRDPVLKTEAPAMQAMQSMQAMQTMQPIQPDIVDDKSPFFGQPAQPALNPNSSFDDVKNDNEGELSIPVEHTTAAHKLLMWPSIKRLIVPHEYDEDYVMRLEEERGLISVYGQGEISSTADDTQLPSTPITRDGGSFDETRINGDSNVLTGATSDPVDVDIDSFGRLSLDAKTARRYYQTYLEKIHQLHPFLNKPELDGKVEAFIRSFCPRDTSPLQQNSTLCRENSRPMKRKRSHEDLQGMRGGSVDAAAASVRPRVGRNIDNAIILLLFALGAICETKSPLPGPIMNRPDYLDERIPKPLPPIGPPPAVNGTHVHNGVPSPANSDSALPTSASFYNSQLHSTSQSFPSSVTEIRGQNYASKRSIPRTRNEFGHVKNLQVIPGLSLYGYATTVLGLLQGGVELEHVQAGLLAGLYAGQLAHPFQSHGWICQAARACQVLVRQKRYERLDDNNTIKDLYNFAYWTCLQLESDLLAELDIPASGISRSEGRMGLPKGVFIPLPDESGAPSTIMMMFYSAQIHLRKVLNRVHTDLYKVEKQGQTRWSSNVQEALSMNLDLWRTSLPTTMSWTDKEPPAKDINAARMRAKYYGARYIIHRPLLYHALHYGQTGARVGSVAQTSVDSPTGSANNSQTQQMSPSMTQAGQRAPGMTRIMSNIGNPPAEFSSFANGWTPPTVALRELPQKLRRACKVCIESAILSTTAFDGIPDRLVVTNIFGTAHAQFGNMLVLSATYMSSLSELVERSVLERLLKRTIRFLLRSENISPTLRADAKILTEIYRKIFGNDPVLN
ncbi:hypothetical protein N7476_006393 [Penicillium atrosanguineum]|uniref:Zn(2)-C6 fungal-type domain-containing protein n=1 Tax=Penicillium atrosanguineum TaxID=1132637 RepID=A0A9W9U4G7_9EURO|nr:hypothetical protein N7476_006393 [Penicillium atrosanguineum]